MKVQKNKSRMVIRLALNFIKYMIGRTAAFIRTISMPKLFSLLHTRVSVRWLTFSFGCVMIKK